MRSLTCEMRRALCWPGQGFGRLRNYATRAEVHPWPACHTAALARPPTPWPGLRGPTVSWEWSVSDPSDGRGDQATRSHTGGRVPKQRVDEPGVAPRPGG